VSFIIEYSPRHMPQDHRFELDSHHDSIALCDLLKLVGLSESGAAAKHSIAAGEVQVDGVVETRKRCKIRRGQKVLIDSGSVTVE
jgi:ribosome-associated protein